MCLFCKRHKGGCLLYMNWCKLIACSIIKAAENYRLPDKIRKPTKWVFAYRLCKFSLTDDMSELIINLFHITIKGRAGLGE